MNQLTTVFQYNIPLDNTRCGFPDIVIEVKAVRYESGGVTTTVLTHLSTATLAIVKDWVRVDHDIQDIAKSHFLAQENIVLNKEELVCKFTRNTN